MAGGSVFLAVWLLLEQHGFSLFTGKKESTVPCQEVVRSEAILSQKQLAQLLTIPEGDKKQRIQEIIKEPYCKLQSLQIRAGTTAQRDAYPLEFDQNTWLVILYEGEQYTGYRFAVR
jgi:hypothetical protein